jgi:DnaJ family protein C protein 8
MSVQASSSSTAPPPSISDDDLEKLLSREASALQRELEVDRILQAFRLKYVYLLDASDVHVTTFDMLSSDSPYDILDIEESATQEEIKRRYRQLSLCELIRLLSVVFK